jgi:hypothetical protein
MAAIAIRERAAEIRKLGAYIGIFEWVAWATFEHVEVKMLFGSNIVSLRAVFAAGMPQRFRTCLRVAAVRARGKKKKWLSAVAPSGELLPVVNHYVIGIACGLSVAKPSGRPPSTSAVKEALRAGWILRATEAKGNCGIDCMCHHVGQPRNPASWTTIREKLADFMDRVAGDLAWHDVFAACQEMPVQAAIPKKGGIGPPTGGIAAWAAVACKEACSMAPKYLLSAGASSLVSSASSLAASSSGAASPAPRLSSKSAASSSAASLSPPPLPPPADEKPPLSPPPLPPPADEQHALVTSVPGCIAGPRAFASYMQTLTPDQLQTMVASVTAFVAAEATWRSEHPSHAAVKAQPRRKNGAFLVNYKYATGLAYNAWLRNAGLGSRAPHKDFFV